MTTERVAPIRAALTTPPTNQPADAGEAAAQEAAEEARQL